MLFGNKKIVLQDIETKKYFGTYRADDFWTDDINEAKEFNNSTHFDIDEQSMDFLNEATVQIVEIVEFKKID